MTDLTDTTNLLVNEKLFRQLAENSPDAILILAWPGPRTVYFNRETFLGYSQTELNDPNALMRYLHPDDTGVVQQQEAALQRGEVSLVEYRLRHQTGHWEWVQSRATPLSRAVDGSLSQSLYTFSLVTDRKHAEEELRASEQRFRALIENTADIITVQDASFVVTYVSPSVEKFVGFPAQGLVGKVGINLGYVHPDDMAKLQQGFGAAMMQPGVPQPPMEYLIRDPQDKWHSIETVIINLLEDPAVRGIVVNARDITARRHAEKALRESEARYRAIMEQSSEAIYLMEAETRQIMDANPAFLQLLGYSADQLSHLKIYDIVVAERNSIDFHLDQVMEKGAHIVGERHYRRADGSDVPVEVTASLLTLEGHRIIATVARDISERKQREAELAQRTDELAALYRASARLLSPGEDVETLAEQVVSALTQEFAFADCGLMLVDEDQGELRRLARAGPYQVRASAPLPLSGQGLTVAAVRAREIVYASDVMVDARYMPNESRTRSELVVPLQYGGKVIGVLDLQSTEPQAFDDRARRIITAFAERAELALANALLVARLNHARRWAEEASRLKSEFLANTSHELRTPLTGILGSLSLILNDECRSTEEAKQFAQIAYDSARNLLNIVNDLLDVAKIEAGKMSVQLQPVDVTALLAEVYMLMWATAGRKHLELQMPMPEAPLYAWADSEKFKQILINLVGNAIKFTEQGRIIVSARAETPFVKIAVEDTGIGISKEHQDQLFRPFVQVDGTSTRRYGGTGLGLSISRSLAQLMGGTIALFSEGEDQGSTFTVTLHQADTQAETPQLNR